MSKVKDRYGRKLRDLRVSLTDQCNFRCAYCMPKEIFGPDYQFLKNDDILSNEEIVTIVKCFVEFGVEKLRLTGGEPLLRKDLIPLIQALRSETSVPEISLTTNGALLPRYAKSLKDSGISRVNVSLDSLDETRFFKISGERAKPQAVLRGIESAIESGLEMKANMVVQRGVNELDILPMAEKFRSLNLTLRFIEYMDVGNSNHWNLNEVFTAKEILDTIQSKYPVEPVEPNYIGEVATRYRYLDTNQEIGIISSISKPFCRDCNRARISADGKLFTCLFASEGTDIKSILRNNEGTEVLKKTLSKIWGQRADRYSEERSKRTQEKTKIEMSYIGG